MTDFQLRRLGLPIEPEPGASEARSDRRAAELVGPALPDRAPDNWQEVGEEAVLRTGAR